MLNGRWKVELVNAARKDAANGVRIAEEEVGTRLL